VVEQVLQTGTEQVDDQDVMEAFLAKVIDIRDPGYEKSVEVRPSIQLYVGAPTCDGQATHLKKQQHHSAERNNFNVQ
jgi:hypothetical protein